MIRHFNDKIGRKKKKSDLENYPLETQLRVILGKFEDPIWAVRDILDPEHKNIVKSDLRVAPPGPKEPTKGVFRVIYATTSDLGGKSKIRTTELEATDGRDAKLQFAISTMDEETKSEKRVIGVECLYVPRSVRNKFLQEFKMEGRYGVVTPLVEIAWATLIEELEVFEDERPAPDLTKFFNDE